MKKILLSMILMAVWMAGINHLILAAGSDITLEAIASKQPGGQITIKGQAERDVLVLQILRPNQTILWTDTVTKQGFEEGKSVTLPADSKAGTYTVLAGAGADKASITFEVVAPPIPGPIGNPSPPLVNGNKPEVAGRLHGSAIALQRLEDAQGSAVLRALVDGERLHEAIKQLAVLADKRLLIELHNEGAEVELVLPFTTLAQLDTGLASAALLIDVDGVRYELPVSAMGLGELREQWSSAMDEWSLLVRIGQPDDNTRRQLESVFKRTGAQELAPAVSFRIQLDTGESLRELQTKDGEYITRYLRLPQGTELANATGAWMNPSTGELGFVPTRFETEAGVSWAKLIRQGNSVYTVVMLNKTFADLEGHWAQSQVERLASMLILKGQSEQAYAPAAAVTRAEFAAMLVRSLGLNEQIERDSAERFTDVRDGAWYEATVATAAAAGLVQGYEDGSFRPTAAISRQQMAVMLVRALHAVQAGMGGELPAVDVEAGMARLAAYADDAALAQWSREAVAEALQRGLMNGVSEASFDPKGETTRAQAAVALQRMLAMLGLIN